MNQDARAGYRAASGAHARGPRRGRASTWAPVMPATPGPAAEADSTEQRSLLQHAGAVAADGGGGACPGWA